MTSERLRVDYHDPTCGVYSVRQICDCTNHARQEAADALEAAEADRDDWKQVSGEWKYRAEAAEAKLKEEKQFASQLCEKLQMAETNLAQAQERLARAVGHLKDMLQQDDGQAYQEAERFVASIEERS